MHMIADEKRSGMSRSMCLVQSRPKDGDRKRGSRHVDAHLAPDERLLGALKFQPAEPVELLSLLPLRPMLMPTRRRLA